MAPRKLLQREKKQRFYMKIQSFVIACYVFLDFMSFIDTSIAIDLLNNSQLLTFNQTLISSGKEFQLGFFNPGNSFKFYLGIWYNHVPTRTYAWVANRDNPLNDTSGALRIGNDGNLVILDKTERIIWSTSIANLSSRTTFVHLSNSGNLVLTDGKVEGDVLWQSFDHPSDSIIAEMKFGRDLKTGLNRYLTSWKSSDDPSPGEYTFSFDLHGLPQAIIWKGSSKRFRTAPWNGEDFGGLVVKINTPFTTELIINPEEVYYSFSLNNDSSVVTINLDYLGVLQFRLWDNSINNWRELLRFPPDNCAEYNYCGPNSICTISHSIICSCLIGYTPKYMQQWNLRIWTGGCIRKYQLDCPKGEGFKELKGIKKPDFLKFWLNTSISMEECKALCMKDCSCAAYTNSDSTGSGHGCVLWFGDLIDIKKLSDAPNDKLYIRVTASDLESESKKRKKIVVIVLTITASILLLLAVFFLIWKRKLMKQGKRKGSQHADEENLELPYFDIATIARATQDFSDLNKIGEGGFGPVYKGVLLNGQVIAVKRLSKTSSQGLDECKNEVALIAKLQHRNLVRLLGCCIREEEQILIYEYMTNGSLDSYIFGGLNYDKTHLLVWRRRFSVIVGIARGLLYLHRDSRLRIIHRDLKASNVLLDSEMNPKISDFGMARTFGEEQPPTKTKRIVGTFGYMSPEYATRGIFSMKSDVFSFGVLVLEIVSGQRNSRFQHPDHDLSLLGHAWNLWHEGRPSELIDPLMEDSLPISEVLRCIQVGLLCVQQRPEDRPMMSSVLLMLDSETAMLAQPKRPGFSTEMHDESTSGSERAWTSNEVTNSMIEGR